MEKVSDDTTNEYQKWYEETEQKSFEEFGYPEEDDVLDLMSDNEDANAD